MTKQWYQSISYTNDSLSTTISCLTPLLTDPLWANEDCQLIIFQRKKYNPFVHWVAVIVFRHRIIKVAVLTGRTNAQYAIMESVNINSIVQLNLGNPRQLLNVVNAHIESLSGGDQTTVDLWLPANTIAPQSFMRTVHGLQQLHYRDA
ncbi:hypothetical protein ACRYI5_10685 [Furfurilactobacillus sp. WILCCON 0119]